MADVTARRRTFVFEDTKNRDYRYIRAGLVCRGWQQVAFPRRQASEGDSHKKGSSKFDLCWVKQRGAMGVASIGLKVARCPDLIWMLSHGRLPGSEGLGRAQVTNFFDRTSCLTTKAGLCRTLQSSRHWGSEHGEDYDSPSSFFPRCFDLSDMSQVDEFKDDFRQTAAEAVLKVFRRFLGSDIRPASSTTNGSKSAQTSNSTTSSPHPILAEHGGSEVGGWFDKVHRWMLALALRACRRRLLELAGWREDQVGAWRTAGGAERLEPLEWDSLLLYSYILRRAVQPLPKTTDIPDCPGNGKSARPHGRCCVAEPNSRVTGYKSDKPEKHTSEGGNRFGLSCGPSNDNDAPNNRLLYPNGVGLRGLQGLRCVPPTEKINRTVKIGRLSRRPSSAPARRQHEKPASEGRYPSPGRNKMAATEAFLTARTGGDGSRISHTAPGVWGVEECKELRDGLSKVWSPSDFARSEGCSCPWDTYEGGDDTNHCLGGGGEGGGAGAAHGPLSQLMEETAQLCVALEKRCPQWKMDGESNLWMLKPAGASRGQGVRLAWTMDQVLYAQKTMGGRVVQKYIELPLLLRRRQPAPSPPTEPVPTEGVPMRPLTPETKPPSSDPGPRRHLHRQHDNLGLSPAPGSRRWTRQSQRGRTNETSETAVMGAIERTIPCLSHSEVEKEPKPPGGTAAAPISLPLRGMDERNPGFSGGKEQRDINIHIDPSSAGATKFDLRVWVLVKGWKPLEAFWFDECYLRVCPQTFTLDEANFGNSDVHLTNLCARQPVDRARTAYTPLNAHARDRRKKQTRPFSASRVKNRCSTKNQNGHDGRTHIGEPADDSANGQFQRHQEDEAGALRAEFHVRGDGSEGFVASQADLIDSLGEMDAGGGRWQPDVTGGLEVDQRRAKGERLWKNKVSPSIKRIIKSSLLAAHSHVRPRTASFQLFGFDVLLDRELTPWLLEVNMSPALSHSSKRQSGMIRSMCEGLLRLTVDRTFPPPQPPPSSDGEETPSLNGPETVTDENGQESKRIPVGSLPHYQLGRWRPLTVPQRPPPRSGQKGGASASTRVAQAIGGRVTPESTCVADPSSHNFTVRGRHLSRRGLVRAERGVRGATAVKVLEDWWGSKVEGCRRLRLRKSWADAVISRWVIRLVTRQRQRAIRAETNRLARLRQRQWRRLSVRILENRRNVAFSKACALVQNAWRAHRLERLWRSKRLRVKMAVGLSGWARALHSRRRNKAAEIALGAALAAANLLRKRKISAAEIIFRTLKTASNRRRQTLLSPQRPTSVPGLFSTVPSAQVLNRADLVQSKAAMTIQRARRNVMARRRFKAIRTASARALQEWFRAVLRNWERRRTSAVVVQRAWRCAKQRRIHAVRRIHPNVTDDGPNNVSESAGIEEPQSRPAAAKARSMNVEARRTTPGVAAGVRPQEGVAPPHFHGRETDGEHIVSSHVISDCASARMSCSSRHTVSTMDGYSKEIFGLDGDSCASSPSIYADELLSQATTAHEDWTVPALDRAEEDVASCSGNNSEGESGSDEAGGTKANAAATVVVLHPHKKTSSRQTREWRHTDARTAQNSSFKTRKTVEQTTIATAETCKCSEGILNLNSILCDFVDTTQPKRVTRKASKRHGHPEVHCSHQASSSRPTAVWGSKPRGLDGRKTHTYSAVGGKTAGSNRAPGRQVHLTGARAQPTAATSSAPRSCNRPHNRCQGSSFIDCAPLSRSTRTPENRALGLGHVLSGGQDAPTEQACRGIKTRALSGGGKRAGVKSKIRQEVPCSRGSNSTRNRNRVPRTGNGTRLGVACGISGTFCTGESGAVLQMLASLEG